MVDSQIKLKSIRVAWKPKPSTVLLLNVILPGIDPLCNGNKLKTQSRRGLLLRIDIPDFFCQNSVSTSFFQNSLDKPYRP